MKARGLFFLAAVAVVIILGSGCEQTTTSEHSDYIVTFKDESGKVLKTETAYSGSVYISTSEYKKDGYDVSFKKQDGTVVSSTVSVSSDMTIIVCYIPHVYTISFVSIYASADQLPADMTVDYRDTIVMPENNINNPSKKADGWIISSSSSKTVYASGQSVIIDGTLTGNDFYSKKITFTANFIDHDYKLTFQCGGELTTYYDKYIYADKGDKITETQLPKAESKKNYTADGWYLKTDDNKQIIDWSSYDVSGDATFIPKYTPGTYKVTFVSAIGTVPSPVTVEVDERFYLTEHSSGYVSEYNYLTEFIPANLDGYTFNGWYDGSGKKVTYFVQWFTDDVNDMTLMAEFTKWKAEIKFDQRGYYRKGNAVSWLSLNGEMTNQEWGYGDTLVLNENKYYASGYKFIGWSKSSNSTDIAYTDKQSISWTDTTKFSQNGQTITLYGVYEELPLKIMSIKVKTSDITDINLVYKKASSYFNASLDGIDTFNWYIDGILKNNENGSTLNTNALSFGVHSVMVTAEKDGNILSSTMVVDVTEEDNY